MFLQQLLNFKGDAIAACHCLGELFVKGSDGLPVSEEEIGFEDYWSNDECFSKESDESHLNVYKYKQQQIMH